MDENREECLSQRDERAFFAAANSGEGFKSFYPDIFCDERTVKRYILKGGPGTGKSRFLREAARRGEKLSYDVEYYYCSSDPTSLDGIIIDKGDRGRISILDGTAPHACDAEIPGARDEIIDLGAFWQSEKLVSRRETIESLMEKKRMAYARASDSLFALSHIMLPRVERALSKIKKEKLDNAGRRMIYDIEADEEYFERIGIMSSFGMYGESRLESYISMCDDLIIVDDSLGVGSAFLTSVFKYLRECGISSYRSYSWLFPNLLDAIYIPPLSLSFVADVSGICQTSEKCKKRINMQRFIDLCDQKEIRLDQRETERVKKELLLLAETEMERMRDAHFSLEGIYVEAMDFSAKEEFSEKWCEENL